MRKIVFHSLVPTIPLNFDRFITNVYDDKLEQIRYFFNHQDERGKNFIYKLIELLRNYDRMNMARLAYYLTRLEELTRETDRDKFKHLKFILFLVHK